VSGTAAVLAAAKTVGAAVDADATASDVLAAGMQTGSIAMAKTARKNAPPIILIFRISKMCFYLCTHVRVLRVTDISLSEVGKSLMAIYQRQSMKFHHGKIQSKKYDAEDNKRSDERQKISFHAVTPSRTTQKKRSRQSEPT